MKPFKTKNTQNKYFNNNNNNKMIHPILINILSLLKTMDLILKTFKTI